MSAKERRRVEVMSRVRDGQVSVAVAAGLLGMSERQAWRLKRRYAAGGDCLMVMIDDATGRVTARFYERETLDASFDVFGRYVKARRGLPRALYVDKAGIYRAEAGCPPTQFGRAMAELGVELILANSPQAKGRVERMNGTLQDRLVKELRLRGVRDMAGANAVLDGPFLKQFNKRFAVKATRKADVHRAVAAAAARCGVGPSSATPRRGLTPQP